MVKSNRESPTGPMIRLALRVIPNIPSLIQRPTFPTDNGPSRTIYGALAPFSEPLALRPLADGVFVFSLQLNEPIYTLSVVTEKPKTSTANTSEELDSRTILDEPKLFQFHYPAFRADIFRPAKQVEATANWKIPTYEPTRLKATEAPPAGLNSSAAVVANNATSESLFFSKELPCSTGT